MLPATWSPGAFLHIRVLSDVLGPRATMPRTLHNHLFNQFLDGLPRERTFGDAFVGARHFSHQDGLHLYLAELPPDVKGGERHSFVCYCSRCDYDLRISHFLFWLPSQGLLELKRYMLTWVMGHRKLGTTREWSLWIKPLSSLLWLRSSLTWR